MKSRRRAFVIRLLVINLYTSFFSMNDKKYKSPGNLNRILKVDFHQCELQELKRVQLELRILIYQL